VAIELLNAPRMRVYSWRKPANDVARVMVAEP